MAFGMLVAAVMTSLTVAGLCFALSYRKMLGVALLQFIAALGVTCLVGPLTVSDIYASDAFWMAWIISAAMPVAFIMVRLIVGRLDKPEAGGLNRHAREPASQRLNW